MYLLAIEDDDGNLKWLTGDTTTAETSLDTAQPGDYSVAGKGGVNEGGGWTYARAYSNQNKVTSRSFIVTKQFDDLNAAAAWDLRFPAWLPTEGYLRLFIRSADRTTWEPWRTTRYCRVVHEGTQVFGLQRTVRYNLTFGELTPYGAGYITDDDNNRITDDSGNPLISD